MATKTTDVKINYANESLPFQLHPVEGASKDAAIFDFRLLTGLTDSDTPRKRFKVVRGQMDLAVVSSVPAIVKKVVEAASVASGVPAEEYDSEALLQEIKDGLKPEDDKEPETFWTDLPEADQLRGTRDNIANNASIFAESNKKSRDSLYAMATDIAEVDSMLTPKQFKAWAADQSAPDMFRKILDGKNSKAEFLFMGRLPEGWVMGQPETCTSPKTFQLRFNIEKAELAETIAGDIYRTSKGKSPSEGSISKALTGYVEEAKEIDTVQGILWYDMLTFLQLASENFGIALIVKKDGKFEPATDNTGKPIASLQYGSQEKHHELLKPLCDELNARTPAEVEKQAEAEKERETSAAVKSRAFPELTRTEQAYHICRIISSLDVEAEEDLFAKLAEINERRTKDEAFGDILEEMAAQIENDRIEKEKADEEAKAKAEEEAAEDDA